MSITTTAGNADAAGVAFLISDGKLPKGIKQVYCNVDGTYRVFSVATNSLVFCKEDHQQIVSSEKLNLVIARRKKSISVTG